MRKLYLATRNAGKVREFQQLLAGSNFEPVRFDGYAEPEEGSASYAENAALKARALAEQLRTAGIAGAVLGDDSGLEVAALGGRPGVLSARYGGPSATWASRRTQLLAEIAASGSADRRARFVCALAYIYTGGSRLSVEEHVDGVIGERVRGAEGFGYDPLFVYEPAGRTFAELPEEEKNNVSHRGRAVRTLLERITIELPRNA
ncbi:MAG: RdgB/HAM1 family non-canonical purine NTP pyrophosphatase [Candidatus Eremiobacteraeota bacterium]|nr:RdgB/HAM1 family non-canonical purine NTP pyrophosphatase [Candidatus Eremiobacteraeota bacterium]